MFEYRCPFCNAPYTQDMLDVYNGTYGCDTGCEYMRVVVVCAECERILYIKGEFGSVETDEERDEAIDAITEHEWREALEGRQEY